MTLFIPRYVLFVVESTEPNGVIGVKSGPYDSHEIGTLVNRAISVTAPRKAG